MDFLRSAYKWAAQAARLMVGVPDYETYVEHRRAERLAAAERAQLVHRRLGLDCLGNHCVGKGIVAARAGQGARRYN